MRFIKSGLSSSAISKVFSLKLTLKLAYSVGAVTLGMQGLPAVAAPFTNLLPAITQAGGLAASGSAAGGVMSGNSPESRMANQLANQGVQAFTSGDQKAAFGYWQQALSLYNAAGDLAGEGRMLENLSVIHRLENQPEEALSLVEQALALYETLGSADDQPSLYLNLGSAYQMADRPLEAIAAYSKGRSIYQRHSDEAGERIMLSLIAQT